MNNPYRPPQADILSNAVSGNAGNYDAKKSMFVAGAITATIGITATIYEYISEAKYGAAYSIASGVGALVVAWYLVVVINAMANGRTSKGVMRQFGVWAFVWRAFVTKLLCVIPMYLIVSPFYPNYSIIPSAVTVIIGGLIGLIFAPVVVWACFSNGRQQQLFWLSNLFARV